MRRGRERRIVVDPILRGQIVQPRVLRSAVIHDHVHDYFHASVPRSLRKFPVFLIATKPWINPVIVRGGVSVIRPLRLVVFQHRIEPNSRKPHAIEVTQVPLYPRQISAVSAMIIGAVQSFQHSFYFVVARVPIGKSIRRDEADRILRAISLNAITTIRESFSNFQFEWRPSHRL